MKKEIKVAIVGVGNCASSFCQGIELFKSKGDNDFPGNGDKGGCAE